MDFTKLQDFMKDDQGRYRTISLFWELRHYSQEKIEPVFTLKSYDLQKEDKLYPSLKKIYLTYDHIPGFEYEFALDVFGSWEHWQKMANSQMLKDHIQTWRDELDVRIKAQSLKAMMLAARDNDAKGVNAAKYLAEKGYAQKRGRPSKAEIEREKKIQAGANKELADDMERIGLKIVEGGK